MGSGRAKTKDQDLTRDLQRVLKAGKHMKSLPTSVIPHLPQVAAYLSMHLADLPVRGKIVQDSLILEFLYDLIRNNLTYHREHYRLPKPIHDSLRAVAIRELIADFQQEDGDLESWSVLFHYHARHDLNFSWDTLAKLVAQEERTLRRRAGTGIYWLARKLIKDALDHDNTLDQPPP